MHIVDHYSHVMLKLEVRSAFIPVNNNTLLVVLNWKPDMAAPLYDALLGDPPTPNTFTTLRGGIFSGSPSCGECIGRYVHYL